MRIVLVNPNTTARVTQEMCALAQARSNALGLADLEVIGLTAPHGAATIIDEVMLAQAADVVASMGDDITAMSPDGVIVGAFGNPGMSHLRASLQVPVVGIGEAALLEAGQSRGGAASRFAVVTTTPGLARAIERNVERLGLMDGFTGVFLTDGEPLQVMADPEILGAALHSACLRAIDAGADTIVIGGGPLARYAPSLRVRLAVTIIEPISASLSRIWALRGSACPPGV